jgi:hypothetical protein
MDIIHNFDSHLKTMDYEKPQFHDYIRRNDLALVLRRIGKQAFKGIAGKGSERFYQGFHFK